MLSTLAAKEQLVWLMQEALRTGLVHGTAGNAACRVDDGNIAVTPSSVAYETMTPDDIVVVSPTGAPISGHRAPSSETALHVTILAQHPEFDATMHCHAKYASAFAVTRIPIPSVIEEVSIYVGGDIRVAEYELTGSEDLAIEVARGLSDRSAVLMANHGLAVAASSPSKALDLAVLVEHTAELMAAATQLGEVVKLPPGTDDQLRTIYEFIRNGSA